jgi:large subunit ribosomal protein L21
MYAVIKTGGKQYKVAESVVVRLERLGGDAGDAVAFGEVLVVGGDAGVTLGSPLVAGAQVAGEIVKHSRSARILVFKKRRRQNSKRSRGHRQDHTVVRITEILTDGKAPSKKAAAKKAAPKPAEATPEAAASEATTDTPKTARKPRAPSAAADKTKSKAKE